MASEMQKDPMGIKFYDAVSGRDTILVMEGEYEGWLCYKHPDGQWVTLRLATENDWTIIKMRRPPAL